MNGAALLKNVRHFLWLMVLKQFVGGIAMLVLQWLCLWRGGLYERNASVR